jgi:uncharacterized protein
MGKDRRSISIASRRYSDCCVAPKNQGLPGTSLISIEAVGADAIIRRAQTIVNFGVNFELKHILLGRDGAALSLHNTAKRGELILDEHLATVMDISDGRITYIKTYLSDIDLVNAFFVAGSTN